MERRGMELLSMSACFLMMFVGGECGELIDNFSDCYGARFSICAIGNNRFYCAAKTLSECSDPEVASTRFEESKMEGKGSAKGHYCELGCALTRCTKISTKLLPKADEVAKCVDSCAETTCKSNSKNDVSKTKTKAEQTIEQFCKLGCAKSLNNTEAEKKQDSDGQYCIMACS